ncbi:hypothetical protein C408_4519 [Vibrio diabolicus E0666]|nr:hypothetical protein C408_4519 [Vibrio diabolicus E0666]
MVCNVALNLWRVVHRIHGDVDRRLVGQCTIGNGISDFGVAIEVLCRCEDQFAINNLDCTLVTRHRCRVNRQLIAINIGVVWQDINRHWCIFVSNGIVIGRHWRIVHWCDINVHRGGLTDPTGGNDVREAVCPVVVVVWRVSHAAVRVDRDRAVGWTVIGIERHHFVVAFERVVT